MLCSRLKPPPEPSQGLPGVEANEDENEDAGVGKQGKFVLEMKGIIGELLEFPSGFLNSSKGEMVDTGGYHVT